MHFEGSICINGVPIGNYDHDSLRSSTGILFHQQDIFQGSLMENISLGDKKVTADQILVLARQIGLETFISSLKDGFDTQIDPAGKRLSGGVVRRILLLRALLSQPRLLLLEEPWQGFNEESQQQIVRYIQKDLKGSTAIIASNEENFARQCDLVVIMEDGRVIKQGSPSEVLS